MKMVDCKHPQRYQQQQSLDQESARTRKEQITTTPDSMVTRSSGRRAACARRSLRLQPLVLVVTVISLFLLLCCIPTTIAQDGDSASSSSSVGDSTTTTCENVDEDGTCLADNLGAQDFEDEDDDDEDEDEDDDEEDEPDQYEYQEILWGLLASIQDLDDERAYYLKELRQLLKTSSLCQDEDDTQREAASSKLCGIANDFFECGGLPACSRYPRDFYTLEARLKCDKIVYSQERPVPDASTYQYMRDTFHRIFLDPNNPKYGGITADKISRETTFTPEPAPTNGFIVPVESKFLGLPKGRGTVAAAPIRKGQIIWRSTQTARFFNVDSYWRYLAELDDDILRCEALQWTYVMRTTTPPIQVDPSASLSQDQPSSDDLAETLDEKETYRRIIYNLTLVYEDDDDDEDDKDDDDKAEAEVEGRRMRGGPATTTEDKRFLVKPSQLTICLDMDEGALINGVDEDEGEEPTVIGMHDPGLYQILEKSQNGIDSGSSTSNDLSQRMMKPNGRCNVMLVALRDIAVGEELVANYGDWEDYEGRRIIGLEND